MYFCCTALSQMQQVSTLNCVSSSLWPLYTPFNPSDRTVCITPYLCNAASSSFKMWFRCHLIHKSLFPPAFLSFPGGIVFLLCDPWYNSLISITDPWNLTADKPLNYAVFKAVIFFNCKHVKKQYLLLNKFFIFKTEKEKTTIHKRSCSVIGLCRKEKFRSKVFRYPLAFCRSFWIWESHKNMTPHRCVICLRVLRCQEYS